MKADEAVDNLLNMFSRTRTNAELVQTVIRQKILSKNHSCTKRKILDSDSQNRYYILVGVLQNVTKCGMFKNT